MTEGRTIVITGVGLATPAGVGADATWSSLHRSSLTTARVFEPPSPPTPAGVVDLPPCVSKRQRAKIDRFTELCFCAVHEALADACVTVNASISHRLGLIVSNSVGGWRFVEPLLYGMANAGADVISPYVATAWFPAAPQGEISIALGIRGHSKTIAADRIGGGVAVRTAARLIALGRLDYVLAGGAEAPLTALIHNAFAAAGRLSLTGRWRPFSEDADGEILSEGAGMLLVEAAETAAARGARVYATLRAAEASSNLFNAMRLALERAHLSASEIDLVLLDASGHGKADREELSAVRAVFTDGLPALRAPKAVWGNMLAASMGADIAIGCLSIARQVLPPDLLGLPGKRATERVRSIMVNGRDDSGNAICIILSQQEMLK